MTTQPTDAEAKAMAIYGQAPPAEPGEPAEPRQLTPFEAKMQRLSADVNGRPLPDHPDADPATDRSPILPGRSADTTAIAKAQMLSQNREDWTAGVHTLTNPPAA